MLTEDYFKGILVRKVYDTIKESQYESIKHDIEELGLSALFEFRTSPLTIKCLNGNRLIARGLDKAEKIKSIKDPSFIWYEEGNEITEEDFNTVSTTVRSSKARFLQEIFSFNPESDTPDFSDFWIYKRFFGHTNEKTFRHTVTVETDKGPIDYNYSAIHSTYKDNPHLPPSIAATYEDFKRTSPYYYNVYTLGQWGNKEVGARFYKTFTMDLVRKTEYNPRLALHISLDENVNPYLTMTVHQAEQVGDVLEVRQLLEICLTHPNNTLRATCEEFERIYSDHKEGVYIYGDRTSKKQDTKLESGENFFTLAANYLSKFRPIERLPSRNPGVKSRGEFINQIFAGTVKEAKIIISDRCTNTIADYLYVKEAADGTKFKEKVTDKTSGVRFEKLGHCFVKGTLVRTSEGLKAIEEIKTGELVWTRKGLRPVLKSGLTRKGAKVRTYEIAGRKITCTADHRIFTLDKGFIEAELLTEKSIFCIFDQWKESKQLTTGLTSIDTQIQKEKAIGVISEAELKTIRKNIYTGIFTLVNLARYRRVTTYTIRTVTTIITKLKTSFASPLYSTIDTIGQKKATIKERKQKKYSKKKRGQRLVCGTEVERVENGTESTLRTFWIKTKELFLVKSAEVRRLQEALPLSFVLASAKTDLTQEYTADVYDLTVKDQHEFFANDILVHNCSDANDYLYIELLRPTFDRWLGGGIVKKPIFGKKHVNKWRL